jgi:hypothetical protein
MNRYLHPEDIQTFLDVTLAMKRVAAKYKLPLLSIEAEPDPDYARAPLGRCFHNSHITLTLRGKTNGVWDKVPVSREEVFKTAGHELAHLKYPNHGLAFQEFEEELIWAMQNEEVDPKQRVIDKILKLKVSAKGEDRVGESKAAEAFAGMINKLMIEHELQPTDLDYCAMTRDDVIELRVELPKYHIPVLRARVAWQEDLARIVANAHLCTFFLRTGSNQIWFVGTKTHATIAEYAYGTLVPAAQLLSDKESYYYRLECKRKGQPKLANGFRESWLNSFVRRIGERMHEAREDTIRIDAQRRAERGEAGDTSQALIRLSGQMKKVEEYVNNKFKMKAKYASALNGGRMDHAEGKARGRAAADSMPIGRKGVGSSEKKQLV